MLGDQPSLQPRDTGAPAVRRLRIVADETYPDWEAIYRDNVTWVYRLLFGKAFLIFHA